MRDLTDSCLAECRETTARAARSRPLTAGYDLLEDAGVSHYTQAQVQSESALEIIGCIGGLIDLTSGGRDVCVIGCGPRPASVRALAAASLPVVGVEAIKGNQRAAQDYVGSAARIFTASAETLPFDDGSFRVVLMETVLEHVDSVERSLSEAFRVLVPDGVLFVSTTARHKFSPIGKNPEFNVRFYNWLPAVVKESYVFRHLHIDPSLANHTSRPAVHWFTFAELCRLGRAAGFAHFFSMFDLVDRDGEWLKRSRWRRLLLDWTRRSAWLRALALTQVGSIFMWKRAVRGPG